MPAPLGYTQWDRIRWFRRDENKGALVAEQPTAGYDEEAAQPAHDEQPQRSLWTLASIILLVVVVALALLMLRGCAAGGGGLDEQGPKTIDSLEGADAVAGVISVWVEESANIDSVLKEAGVAADSTVSLGGGRYLVIVSEGLEESSARAIAEQDRVNDVGRVFESTD